jgi:Spy/CpxP family protein refolding chaperone
MFHGRLDLRPDQLAHVELESGRLQTELHDLHQLLAQESAVLSDLMVAPEPDREAIAAQLDKLAALHAQKQEYVVNHFLRFRELLDDDQREIFAQTIRDVFARWGARPPGWGGPHMSHEPRGRHGPHGGRPPWHEGG